MIIRDRHKPRKTSWLEDWLNISFPEKMITILWCGMPYLIWIMADGLGILYKILTSMGVWIFLTLCCYWFGKFMGSEERHWN